MGKCEDCQYWFKVDVNGECRRNPPVPFVARGMTPIAMPNGSPEIMLVCYFPRTRPEFWCGEFQIAELDNND